VLPREGGSQVLPLERAAKGSSAGGGSGFGFIHGGFMYRTLIFACATLAAALSFATGAQAQTGVTLSGRLVNSLSGDPIPGAVVLVEELRLEMMSAADGTFRFENVPAGTYHLSVHSQGYSTRRIEVAAGAAASDLRIDPELHFEEVTTVAGEARSQFDAFQATSVLSGQELTKQLESSIGATLQSQPGVAMRSLGPGPSRPVVRGLDGDRVLILQDGQRIGDVSSQSGDHGVPVNPAAAQRIEVVRGPATLLYGANAIGGLVNIITDDIPSRPVMGASGNATFDVGSAARDTGAAASMQVGNGKFAAHFGGGGRHTGDYDTPEGKVPNSQLRSGFGNVGGAWTGERGYFGANYGYDDTKYGIPLVESGDIQLTPRRHAFTLRGGTQSGQGVIDTFRATLAVRRYKHEELEGTEVGTAFRNDTNELEVMGSHRAIGRLKGSAGLWALDRTFDAVGEEALSPRVDQRGAAAFLYEEVTWPHVTFQFGGRLDHTKYSPLEEDERSFTNGSGSVGLLVRPAAADDRLTLAISVARASRTPALEELFFLGVHPGNFAIEIGNPGLEPERAVGLDVSLRARGPRASAEFTYFRNAISNYIFRNPLTEAEFIARQDEFAARFPNREVDFTAEEIAEFQLIDFVGRDSLLQGVEAHADLQTSNFGIEIGADYVRGQVQDTKDPLPRIPPFRIRIAPRYQRNALQVGGEVAATAKQERVFGAETATDGYTLLKLFASYSFGSDRLTNTVTFRVDNLTNELYRNHLSFLKELAPEMGRNVKLLYNVKF
jgi:iron complex outermembrane recepter protein